MTKNAQPAAHVKDRLCAKGLCDECGQEAPLKVILEAWPAQARAKATLIQDGKTRDIEISSFALQMILGALKNAR